MNDSGATPVETSEGYSLSDAPALLADLCEAANNLQTVNRLVRYALHRVYLSTGWPVGHAFLPAHENPSKLSLAVSRYAARAHELHEATLSRKLTDKMGLPVEVWRLGVPGGGTDLEALAPLRARIARDAGMRTVLAAPISVGARTVGVLEFFSDRAFLPDRSLLRILTAVGTTVGRLVERVTIQEDFVQAISQERQIVGRLLHDGLAQELTAISFLCEGILEDIPPEDASRAGTAHLLRGGIRRAIDQVRAWSRGLFSMESEPEDLACGLQSLAEQAEGLYGIRCRFHCPSPIGVENRRTLGHLYHIAKEALTNSAKHSGGTEVQIRLEGAEGGGVRLTVQDNGRGFDPAAVNGAGTGIRIMRYRAAAIGASLELGRIGGGGARLACHLGEDGEEEDSFERRHLE